VHHAEDDFDERRFTGAVRPQKTEDLPLIYLEVHAGERPDLRVVFYQTKCGYRIHGNSLISF